MGCTSLDFVMNRSSKRWCACEPFRFSFGLVLGVGKSLLLPTHMRTRDSMLFSFPLFWFGCHSLLVKAAATACRSTANDPRSVPRTMCCRNLPAQAALREASTCTAPSSTPLPLCVCVYVCVACVFMGQSGCTPRFAHMCACVVSVFNALTPRRCCVAAPPTRSTLRRIHTRKLEGRHWTWPISTD